MDFFYLQICSVARPTLVVVGFGLYVYSSRREIGIRVAKENWSDPPILFSDLLFEFTRLFSFDI
jgi:hypothetical protein